MPHSIIGRRSRGWFSTSVVVASGSNTPTAEIDIRGRFPTHLFLSKVYSTGYIGFKGRPEGYSTSNVVYGGASESSDTQTLLPLKLALNTIAKCIGFETSPGLLGLGYIKPYFCSKTSANTSSLNITGGAITIWISGVE
jgi:hypothetical protein